MLLWNGRQPSCLLGPDAGKRHLVIELSWACWINSCLSNDFRWTARNTEKENRSQCIFPFPKKTLKPRDFSTSVLKTCWTGYFFVVEGLVLYFARYLSISLAPTQGTPTPIVMSGDVSRHWQVSPEIDKCHLEGQNHSSIEPLLYISVLLTFQGA